MNRGVAPIVIILALALVGGGLWVAKPRLLHGDSQRADTSVKTTENLVKAVDKQGAVVAASVVKIGEANATAPDSPEKTFITKEVALALAGLPSPDQTALIEAERRKVAVLEGKNELVTQLYQAALKESAKNAKDVINAVAAKRSSDAELERVAAERLASDRLVHWAVAIALVFGVLYLYVKVSHVSPSALAELKTDLTSGIDAHAALDSITNRFTQWMVRKIKA